MKGPSKLAVLGVALLSSFVVLTVLLDTRIVFIRESESDLLIVAMNRLAFVLGPVSVLLFAAGVHWAAEKRWGRAALALPALPIWSLVLLEVQTFTSQLMWSGLFLAHTFQGLQPFGAPPT